MINTKDVKRAGLNKFINVGLKKVKINNIEAYEAKSGNFQFKFSVETEPINTEGFVPLEGFKGQVGTIKTVYCSNPDMEAQVGTMIANLADETDTREQVNALSQDLSYPEYAQKLTELVKDKYVWVCVNGKEFVNQNTGKRGTELNFPRFKAWASQEKYDKLGENSLAKPYLKPLVVENVDTGVSKEELDW